MGFISCAFSFILFIISISSTRNGRKNMRKILWDCLGSRSSQRPGEHCSNGGKKGRKLTFIEQQLLILHITHMIPNFPKQLYEVQEVPSLHMRKLGLQVVMLLFKVTQHVRVRTKCWTQACQSPVSMFFPHQPRTAE